MRVSKAFLLLGALAWAVPALAQDWKGMGRVEGKVTDTDGKPVADAIVKMQLPGRGQTQLKADNKGHWAILGVAGGNWDLDFEAKGFDTKSIRVHLSEGSPNLPIEVKLAKSAPKGPPPEVLEAIQKGDEAYKAGRFADAREQYEKLLTMRPELAATLHMQIARCYSQEKNYAKELEQLQAILDADPKNADIRKLMALEAFQGGMIEKGEELLKGLDDSAIQDPDVYYNVAVPLFNNQKMEAAVGYLTKALTLNPKYADGYFLRGKAYLSLGKMAEAKADFQKMIEVAPDDPNAATAKAFLSQLK
jgi:tetratricopeptide (TPR) repeat protein